MDKLKKHIYDESNGLYYMLVGDYYIPDLKLPGEEPLHRTLWAAAPGISQTGTPGTVQFPYPDREIVDIPC